LNGFSLYHRREKQNRSLAVSNNAPPNRSTPRLLSCSNNYWSLGFIRWICGMLFWFEKQLGNYLPSTLFPSCVSCVQKPRQSSQATTVTPIVIQDDVLRTSIETRARKIGGKGEKSSGILWRSNSWNMSRSRLGRCKVLEVETYESSSERPFGLYSVIIEDWWKCFPALAILHIISCHQTSQSLMYF
jgi:hypothetical protein